MKIHYYLMSMALAATALVGFTACDDDDDYEDVFVVGADQNTGNVGFTEPDIRVKIGPENAVAIPVEGSLADIKAYSLDTDVAIVVNDNGVPKIEGLKNGFTKVMVSDGNGNYEALGVAVYTTEVMKLNYNTIEATAVTGTTVAITGIEVAEGNGNYSATCEDSRISVYMDPESGELAVNAKAEEDPYTATVVVSDQSQLHADLTVNVSKASHRVKIGADTRELLPFTGDFTAQIAPNSKAELYTDPSGKVYIEGLANGTAVVTAQQGDTYYFYTYSVYTTDVMTLSATSLNMITPLGIAGRNTDCSVTAGNGDYTISSNNSNVQASISRTTGEITINATSRKNPYTAVLTVSDCTGLTATLTVTVTASMEAFTTAEIDEIKTLSDVVYGDVKDPSDGTVPYYFNWYKNYGVWYKGDVTGDVKTIGWWGDMWGSNYGGLKIEVPADAALNVETTGTLYYAYSTSTWYPTYTYEGKAKVIVDDDSKIGVIFWDVDMENERINRGYAVINK